jgi:transposase
MSGANFSRRYAIVAETRRRWSDAENQAIIAEVARPDANISAVARRHGIKPSLLFRWRRMAVTLALPLASAAAPRSRGGSHDLFGCTALPIR